MAPLGYLNQKRMDKKCQIIVDPDRAHVIKQMFEKVAYEGWSGRKVYNWLKFDLNFYTRGNKPLTLSGVYRIFNMTIYYGPFEYPRGSGNWYQGAHESINTKELFDKLKADLKVKKEEIDVIKKTLSKDMYLTDLTNLKRNFKIN
jgi:hypothetical protein